MIDFWRDEMRGSKRANSQTDGSGMLSEIKHWSIYNGTMRMRKRKIEMGIQDGRLQVIVDWQRLKIALG